ncbi:MAG: hypothetical protein RLY78_1229 [Pseudomonadota bacterium]
MPDTAPCPSPRPARCRAGAAVSPRGARPAGAAGARRVPWPALLLLWALALQVAGAADAAGVAAGVAAGTSGAATTTTTRATTAALPPVTVRIEDTGLDDPPLRLRPGQQSVDAWPAVRMLSDPAHRWNLNEVRARAALLQEPTGPLRNLGPRPDTVWLHLPLAVDSSDPDWVLHIDYPALQEVEVFHLRDGQLLDWQLLGSQVPHARRPLGGRTPAMPLDLRTGHDEQLWLRVRTDTAMVLPITLMRPDHLLHLELQVQLVEGLLAGIALALVVYSLVQALALRSTLFLLYAVSVISSGLFSFNHFGLAGQYLWPQPGPLTLLASPALVLLAVASASGFVSQALEVRRHDPRLLRPMQLVGLIALAFSLMALAGLLPYRLVQLAASVLGPALMLLAVPAAWRTGRRGQVMGWYMLAGWGAYMVGVLGLAGLVRGLLPANELTQHLCQVGWLIEMVAWLRVLGLHVDAVRHQAEQAELGRRTMESLAHTDPLTGLPNRRGLQAAMAPALALATPGRALALYLIDLDGFKPVNDRWGHETGDELLCLVAQRLREQVRLSDVVARIGGDEFVIVAGGIGGDPEACVLGRKLLAAFERPFSVAGGQDCCVGLTIGYALAPHDGHEAGELLRRADAAMYAGKQAGRHCLRRGAMGSAAAREPAFGMEGRPAPSEPPVPVPAATPLP